MQYWNGSKWINIQLGLNGQNLTICNGVPVWGPCTNTFTSSPTNNSFEGIINPYAVNTFINGLQQFYIKAWTNNGEPFNGRYMVKIDQSSIPPNAIIDSAKLYIYGDPAPINGNKIDAHYGPTNAFYIQRITSVWNVSGMYTWSNPPTATTTNQVLVTQSTSSFQDDVVDVTKLIKDMQVNGNNGFFMRLQTEVTYNSRQYLSSFYGDASKRPRLVISYH